MTDSKKQRGARLAIAGITISFVYWAFAYLLTYAFYGPTMVSTGATAGAIAAVSFFWFLAPIVFIIAGLMVLAGLIMYLSN